MRAATKYLLIGLLALPLACPISAQAQTACQFVLGFARFHAAAPSLVGDCVQNQVGDSAGNQYQATTNGWLTWRKSDGGTFFQPSGSTRVFGLASNGGVGYSDDGGQHWASWTPPTPQQQAADDAWLRSAQQQLISELGSVSPTSGTVIESRIDGEFNGWEGETVYRLTNSQVWQQSAYYYHYHYAYMPSVLIYSSSSCGSGYAIKVEDDDGQAVCVTRLL